VPRPGGNRIAQSSQNIDWRESGGPRCIPVRAILGAAQITQDSIDLVLRDATRIRARLERRCPAMDYYFGVYVRPNPDGMLCADRDAFRARVAQARIQTSVHYPPVHGFSIYAAAAPELPVTEAYAQRAVTLPLFATMTTAQQDEVVAAIHSALDVAVA